MSSGQSVRQASDGSARRPSAVGRVSGRAMGIPVSQAASELGVLFVAREALRGGGGSPRTLVTRRPR